MKKYYAIETEEGREFSTKRDIEGKVPGCRVLIPIESRILDKDGLLFRVFEKRVEGYVIMETDELTKKDASKVRKIDFVLGVISDSKRNPSELPYEEVERFVGDYDLHGEDLIKKEALLIEGTYAGYNCIVTSKIKDEFEVIVLIKNKPKVYVPIWYLAKEVTR